MLYLTDAGDIKEVGDEKFYLVCFHEEDRRGIVPLRNIVFISDSQPKEGDVVDVMWHDKRQYTATFLMAGNIVQN